MTGMKRMSKSKKKWVLILGILIVVIAATVLIVRFRGTKDRVEAGNAKNNTIQLAKMDLTDSISATGTLSSADSKTVSAALGDITVKKVLVSVGDTVAKGDSLVRFDKSDLEDALEDARDNLSDTKSSADREVSNSSSQLSDAQENYSAEKTKASKEVAAAKASLAAAKKSVKKLQNQIQSASAQEKTALQQQLKEAQEKQEQAQNTYDTAVSNQSSSNRQNKSSIENAQSALETAKSNRTKNVKEAQKQVDEAQANLDACAITAPIAGVVTSVGVSEGDSYSGGTIATIEDISNFCVTTTVDEYDISKVEVGQKVVVLTEATDETEWEGEISFIAPSTSSTADATASTAGQSGEGNSSSSTGDGYEVRITLNSTDDTRLKLGMTAKCSIILEEANDVWAVPYDAVTKNREGSYITVLDEETSEEKQISVTTGMETDYYIAVEGSDLTEGMQVVIPGDEITTSTEDSNSKEDKGMSGFGMGGDMGGHSGKMDQGGRDSGGGNQGGAPGGGMSGGAPGGN